MCAQAASRADYFKTNEIISATKRTPRVDHLEPSSLQSEDSNIDILTWNCVGLSDMLY